MPWARIVGGIGRTLIAAGILLLLFVAYQLWGTGLAEAQSQADLRDDFRAALAAPSTTTTSPTTMTTAPPGTDTVPDPAVTTAAPTTVAPPTTTAPMPEGSAVALIRIPRIGVDKAVVEGVGVGDLEKGPGHYPSTPLPGRPGNAAIAGHRTTYGAPFGDLGELEVGDEILVTTREGDFRYLVDRISVVSPDQVEVLDASTEARITLTTCHPRFSARQRLIVSGVLDGEPVPTPPTTAPAPVAPPLPDPGVAPDDPAIGGEPAPPPGAGSTEVADDPVVEQAQASLDDPSLAGDPAARRPAAAWGLATAAIALGAWLLGKRWRRWPSYLLLLPFGGFTLFLCFEQIARMLPSNI